MVKFMDFKKSWWRYLIALIVIVMIVITLLPKPVITDFESCIKAGNPAMESYPRQCRDQNSDRTFTEVIDEPVFLENN